jgi:hypothetical protein
MSNTKLTCIENTVAVGSLRFSSNYYNGTSYSILFTGYSLSRGGSLRPFPEGFLDRDRQYRAMWFNPPQWKQWLHSSSDVLHLSHFDLLVGATFLLSPSGCSLEFCWLTVSRSVSDCTADNSVLTCYEKERLPSNIKIGIPPPYIN